MTTSPPDERAAPGTRASTERLMRRATYASMAVAIVLIFVKSVAWAMTGSVAMLSTLVDSVLDAAASLINLLAVRHSLQPADREHRFGHGKAEPLAGLGQAMFIGASSLFLLYQAGQRFLEPQPVAQGAVGVGVMLLSIALTIALVGFQRHVIRRTGSVAISADSLHYASDLMVNGGVIVAMVLSVWFGLQIADPVIAALIGLYILYSAAQIAKGAYDQLMDREFGEADRGRIKEIVAAHPEVGGLHDLRTRMSGVQSFIQFHIELDGQLPLAEAHRIADEVEAAVREAFPNAEIIIHQDPDDQEDDTPHFAA